jgi:hypothetical protein
MPPSIGNTAGRFDVIVFSFVLLLAVVCSGAGVAVGNDSPSSRPSSSQQTFEGIVTDTRCAAKHSSTIGLSAGSCTIQCVRMGERFSLVDGDTNYTLDGDLQVLKPIAGQRVKISGTLQGNDLTFTAVTPE